MPVPSLFFGVKFKYTASLFGLPPQAEAAAIRWLTGSTSSFAPNAWLRLGIVEPKVSNAPRTLF